MVNFAFLLCDKQSEKSKTLLMCACVYLAKCCKSLSELIHIGCMLDYGDNIFDRAHTFIIQNKDQLISSYKFSYEEALKYSKHFIKYKQVICVWQ